MFDSRWVPGATIVYPFRSNVTTTVIRQTWRRRGGRGGKKQNRREFRWNVGRRTKWRGPDTGDPGLNHERSVVICAWNNGGVHSARAFLRILELPLERYAKIFAEVGTCNLRPVGFGDWSRWNSEERMKWWKRRGREREKQRENGTCTIAWSFEWRKVRSTSVSSVSNSILSNCFRDIVFPCHSGFLWSVEFYSGA